MSALRGLIARLILRLIAIFERSPRASAAPRPAIAAADALETMMELVAREAAAIERRRIANILDDALAARLPLLALRLAATANISADEARQALAIVALHGGLPPSADAGAELVH